MNVRIRFNVANEIDDLCQLLILSTAAPFHALHFNDIIRIVDIEHHVRQLVLLILCRFHDDPTLLLESEKSTLVTFVRKEIEPSGK